MNYYHKIFSPVDETDFKNYRRVSLLKKEFLEQLENKKLKKLVDGLEKLKDWCNSVKQFRNPAAHNIPLFVPIATFTENDWKLHEDLDARAAELINSGKYEEGMDLVHQSYNVGTHYPIFITQFPKKQIYNLTEKVNEDHTKWLELVLVVFEFGFEVNGG